MRLFHSDCPLVRVTEYYALYQHQGLATGMKFPHVTAPNSPFYSLVCPSICPVCGRLEKSNEGRQKVLGGEVAGAGAFPWQVLLLVPGRGGAAVIAPKWIMTAAHNLASASKDAIKVVCRCFCWDSWG